MLSLRYTKSLWWGSRPIAASHSSITRPISTFVDELIKPKVRMPKVLRDSDELIQLLGRYFMYGNIYCTDLTHFT